MRISELTDLWWKSALIYCIDVRTWFDSNGDGVGDLPGAAERVDYLAELGVTCIWLMPFYPTGGRDDGYDITDFYGVDPEFGSLGDLVELVGAAHARGIRVIADLVVNHTSDQHPWFRASRSSTDNPFRDYYIWRADPPPDTSDIVVFHGEQDAIWTRDEPTGQWYLHRFYKQQPDLNYRNPKVRDEIGKIIGFWLQLGLDGFRVDAVPQLLSVGLHDDFETAEFDDPYAYLRSTRKHMERRAGHSALLGEVNLPYDEQVRLFGTDAGGELDMMFDFVAMQNLYLSLARADAGPLVRALRSRPEPPEDAQWVMFARNHDELTLDQLSGGERQEVIEAFGPEERMQVYGRGLTRRLPPMLGGDQRRIRMVYSLLFSLPGTPALFYGEEIGMGEDLDVPGRLAVRTPMQWTSGVNGGFSTASPSEGTRDIVDGAFGPENVNVADQKHDPHSLFAFMVTLSHRYRECPELAWGRMEVLNQPVASVLAHRLVYEGSSTVALHNLADDQVTVHLRLGSEAVRLVDVLQPGECQTDEEGTVDVELKPYGYRWLRVQPPEHRHTVPQLSTTADTRVPNGEETPA